VGELLRALSLSPANIDARRNLVEAYRALGDTDHAILESYKVLRSASEDVETRIALAKMLLTRGDSEEATNQLHIALRSNPDSVDGWNVLKQAEKVIPKP
jgi:Flp pilus assembly protein TadD